MCGGGETKKNQTRTSAAVEWSKESYRSYRGYGQDREGGNWEAGGGREGNEMALVAQRALMTCDDDNDDDDDKMRTRGLMAMLCAR